MIQYEKNTYSHYVKALDGSLVASYGGVRTLVSGKNINRVYNELSVSGIAAADKNTAFDESRAVVLTFSDGAVYAVAPDPSVDDGVIIRSDWKGKVRYYKSDGYNQMAWLVKAVSLEGVYEATAPAP
jgi:hypothetical protein